MVWIDGRRDEQLPLSASYSVPVTIDDRLAQVSR